MDKKDQHTTIFPFCSSKDYEQRIEVGKCKRINGLNDLEIRIKDILSEAERAEAFSIYDYKNKIFLTSEKIDLVKVILNGILENIRDIRDIRYKVRYETLDVHIENDLLHDASFMEYLKNRLEEEFVASYRYVMMMRFSSGQKAYCLLDNFCECEMIFGSM